VPPQPNCPPAHVPGLHQVSDTIKKGWYYKVVSNIPGGMKA